MSTLLNKQSILSSAGLVAASVLLLLGATSMSRAGELTFDFTAIGGTSGHATFADHGNEFSDDGGADIHFGGGRSPVAEMPKHFHLIHMMPMVPTAEQSEFSGDGEAEVHFGLRK